MRRWTRAALPTLILSSLAALLWPRGSQSLPLYATRTGLLCASCHFDPNGGGPRNEFGFAFARNRHRLEPEDSTSQWHDLSVVNKIGDNMPVFIGLNQRFMLLADDTGQYENLDRVGFFNMENAIYLTIQPHPKLTLVYSRDGFEAGSITQDAFGMIGGGPWNSYLKAGRFRTPFGLRTDDHTVATRAAFLDYQSGELFLPYDPRFPDEGFEIGGDRGACSPAPPSPTAHPRRSRLTATPRPRRSSSVITRRRIRGCVDLRRLPREQQPPAASHSLGLLPAHPARAGRFHRRDRGRHGRVRSGRAGRPRTT